MHNNKFVPLGILPLFMLTIMAGAAVSPALADIQIDLNVQPPTLVKMVLTVPALFIIPTSFIVGRHTAHISKKLLALAGVALYTTTGSMAYFAQDIYQLLASRAFLGIAVGIIMPIASAMIADYYAGENKIKMMGFGSACANLGGIIATFSSGLLATMSWRYAFLVYLAGVLVFIMVLIFGKDAEKPVTSKNIPRKKLPAATYFAAFPGFLVFVGFYSIPTNIAVYMTSTGLGGPPEAGYALAFSTGTAMIMGLLVSKFKRAFGSFFVASIAASMLVCHLLLGYTSHILTINIAMIANGYTLSMAFPYLMHKATETSNGNNVAATSTVTLFIFVGQFFSPIILDFLTKILNTHEAASTFRLVAALTVPAVVYTLILAFRKQSSAQLL